MSRKKYSDIYAGGLILIIGAVLLAASFFVPRGAAVTIGSDFMPKVTCGLMMVLGLWILKEGLNSVKKCDGNDEKDSGIKEVHYKELIISVVLLFAYMLFLVPVGFLIMTTVYIGAQATVLAPAEKKNPVKFTLIGLVAAVAIYFIFRNVFILMLPVGVLSFLG